MDAKVLVIVSLGSLVLIIGAVAALWLRARKSSSGVSATMPAPTASARREEATKKAEKEAQEPPRGQMSQPPAEPPPTFGYGGVTPPASATQPPAPPPPAPAPSFGSVSPPPTQAPGAVRPPVPMPQPAPPQPKPVEPVPVDGIPAAPPPQKPAIEVPLPVPPPAPIAAPAPAPQPVEDKPKADEDGEETEASLPADWLSVDDESAVIGGVIPELPYLEGGFDEDEFADEAAAQSPGKAVLFSAYYPKEIAPEKWEPLHAYIFREMATAAVEADADKQLGSRKAEFRGVRAPAKTDVPEGALVTATPQMTGFQFNPPSVTIGFYKDWHRFDFEVRAKDAPLNQSTNGLLTFTVEGIIIADVPLSIFLGENTVPASNQANAVAKAYEAIFCSYSHKDQHIVERAERAYKALGLDYLRDVVSLKSGQDWSDELLTLINRADIFQLFWSAEAAQSQHVRFEWEHALQVAGWRANFIRPVYWEDPKPHIPDELKHIHFAYQPDLDV